MSDIMLSICIPTFNRRSSVLPLVRQLLSYSGSFEVCVHDDGSTDGTYDELDAIGKVDYRLTLSRLSNKGRAFALQQAVCAAQGRYIMLFDDDDEIYDSGFARILADCHRRLPEDIAGFIYQMSIEGELPAKFSTNRANLISLRADGRIRGDKKEIVRSDLLKPVIASQPSSRRVPTSLYWAQIAMRHDIICCDHVIGNKNYRAGGMTNAIKTLKAGNPLPMAKLYHYRVSAFLLGRYRSPVYFSRSIFGWLVYSLRSAVWITRSLFPSSR